MYISTFVATYVVKLLTNMDMYIRMYLFCKAKIHSKAFRFKYSVCQY